VRELLVNPVLRWEQRGLQYDRTLVFDKLTINWGKYMCQRTYVEIAFQGVSVIDIHCDDQLAPVLEYGQPFLLSKEERVSYSWMKMIIAYVRG